MLPNGSLIRPPTLSEGAVSDRSHDLRARSDRLLEDGIRVRHPHAQEARHDRPFRGAVECQHDGVADPDLTVADRAALGRHAAEFLSVEHLRNEVKECSGVVGDDPGATLV